MLNRIAFLLAAFILAGCLSGPSGPDHSKTYFSGAFLYLEWLAGRTWKFDFTAAGNYSFKVTKGCDLALESGRYFADEDSVHFYAVARQVRDSCGMGFPDTTYLRFNSLYSLSKNEKGYDCIYLSHLSKTFCK